MPSEFAVVALAGVVIIALSHVYWPRVRQADPICWPTNFRPQDSESRPTSARTASLRRRARPPRLWTSSAKAGERRKVAFAIVVNVWGRIAVTAPLQRRRSPYGGNQVVCYLQ